jgi:hypothetical protein
MLNLEIIGYLNLELKGEERRERVAGWSRHVQV